MSYSINSLTDNCYDGTTCLINKLDIRDERQLDIVESHITLAKISVLQQNPIDGNFDFEHYKKIHKFLFEDLYDWAGLSRAVDISKKGTSFVKAENIEKIADACFDRHQLSVRYTSTVGDDAHIVPITAPTSSRTRTNTENIQNGCKHGRMRASAPTCIICADSVCPCNAQLP